MIINDPYFHFRITNQKSGYFVDECHLPKKNRSKGEEKVNVAKQDNEESSLLIILSDNHSYVLFQGLSGFLDY